MYLVTTTTAEDTVWRLDRTKVKLVEVFSFSFGADKVQSAAGTERPVCPEEKYKQEQLYLNTQRENMKGCFVIASLHPPV